MIGGKLLGQQGRVHSGGGSGDCRGSIAAWFFRRKALARRERDRSREFVSLGALLPVCSEPQSRAGERHLRVRFMVAALSHKRGGGKEEDEEEEDEEVVVEDIEPPFLDAAKEAAPMARRKAPSARFPHTRSCSLSLSPPLSRW